MKLLLPDKFFKWIYSTRNENTKICISVTGTVNPFKKLIQKNDTEQVDSISLPRSHHQLQLHHYCNYYEHFHLPYSVNN